MQANVPALIAIIMTTATRNPPTVAARTKALTPRAAPTCRTNCWLAVALPMRATGYGISNHHGKPGGRGPMPAPEIRAVHPCPAFLPLRKNDLMAPSSRRSSEDSTGHSVGAELAVAAGSAFALNYSITRVVTGVRSGLAMFSS